MRSARLQSQTCPLKARLKTISRLQLQTNQIMASPSPAKDKFNQWAEGINNAAPGDIRWNQWDCEVQLALSEFNQHLQGVANYVPPDWRFIKSMLWVESGAGNEQWRIKPMQIGVAGDPGLKAFLSGEEGGELILPPLWRGRLTMDSARTMPAHNIRAGIGYLLMRMAYFEYQEVPSSDPAILETSVKKGDSLSRIAQQQGTTVGMLQRMNANSAVLQLGQKLIFRKASIQRVITGWRPLTSQLALTRYNGEGDPNYARKLDHAMAVVRAGKEVTCAP